MPPVDGEERGGREVAGGRSGCWRERVLVKMVETNEEEEEENKAAEFKIWAERQVVRATK